MPNSNAYNMDCKEPNMKTRKQIKDQILKKIVEKLDEKWGGKSVPEQEARKMNHAIDCLVRWLDNTPEASIKFIEDALDMQMETLLEEREKGESV